MTHIIKPHREALTKLVVYALRLKDEGALDKAKQLLADLIGDEAEYSDLVGLTLEDFRASAEQVGWNVPRARFKDLESALRMLGMNTPVCPKCRRVTIVKQAEAWTTVRSGKCPHDDCDGLIEQVQVVTHHRSWLTGQLVSLEIKESRDFGPTPIPITEEGIEAFLRREMGGVAESMQGHPLTTLANMLWAHHEFRGRFQHPTEVLGALANPQAHRLFATDLARLFQIAQEAGGPWCARTDVHGSSQARQALPARFTLNIEPARLLAIIDQNPPLTEGQAKRKIRELFVKCFNESELRIFVTDYKPVLHAQLPGSGSLLDVAHGVVELLSQHGYLSDKRLWHELALQRPARMDEIIGAALSAGVAFFS